MSLFGECTLKNLTAEYVEEQMALKEAADVSVNDETEVETIEEAGDVSVNDIDVETADDALNESYIDSLLEALDLD